MFPGDRQRVQQTIQDAIDRKCVFESEHRGFRADGTIGWTHARSVPMLDAAGQIVEWIGLASDITARERAEPENTQRVLVVDDNCDAAESLGMLLEMENCKVSVAYDGLGALEVLDSFKPDIALLDIGAAA